MDKSLSQENTNSPDANTSPPPYQATGTTLRAKALTILYLLMANIASLSCVVVAVNDCPLTVPSIPAVLVVAILCINLLLAMRSEWSHMYLYVIYLMTSSAVPFFFPCDTRRTWILVVYAIPSSAVFHGAVSMHPGGRVSMVCYYLSSLESYLCRIGLCFMLSADIVVEFLQRMRDGLNNESPVLSVPEDLPSYVDADGPAKSGTVNMSSSQDITGSPEMV
ncbi:hypothetical protein CPB85DRAFT_1312118 [Mucidula mucida]|nr:hypothetical protein CPB85DRAFT_1312118 [Mucidula mucida]